MPTYHVRTKQCRWTLWEVEAEDEEEAKWLYPEGEVIDEDEGEESVKDVRRAWLVETATKG